MSQEGRGCLVGDQGGSDKVAQFKIEGLRSGSAVPPSNYHTKTMLLFVFNIILRDRVIADLSLAKGTALAQLEVFFSSDYL